MDRAAIRDILAKAQLFQGLDAGALDEVAGAAQLVGLAAGAALFEQDDPAEAFYVVLAGRLKVAQLTPEGHQVVLRYIGPGEMVGAVPLFTGTGYPAAASAVVDGSAARWDRAATRRLTAHHPALLANALEIVGARLQELQARYRELATQRVEQRVARAILRLLAQAGQAVEEGVRIEFPLLRQDIAEMTGTTLHTVSRILSAWEHAGLMRSERMRIVIRRPRALRAIADDLRADDA